MEHGQHTGEDEVIQDHHRFDYLRRGCGIVVTVFRSVVVCLQDDTEPKSVAYDHIAQAILIYGDHSVVGKVPAERPDITSRRDVAPFTTT
jgi:hypothetical protein